MTTTSSATTAPRVAEVAREHGWHPPKSLDSDKKFKPKHTLFCRELRFVAIYALLEIFANSLPVRQKNLPNVQNVNEGGGGQGVLNNVTKIA